ncbi:MAG: glycosyltransferase family 4 protein [Verrucomicrobia bacterium]|nr:glycosyltransferase family 4 protein [Verrucomicrobiota bacterium]
MNNQIAASLTRENPRRSLIASVPTDRGDARGRMHAPPIRPAVAVLTGGGDRPYALGLATALINQGLAFDFIASDELDHPDLRRNPLVHFLNLRKEMGADVPAMRKILRVLLYYWRLIVYAATAKPRLFHILWNNKFVILDRTLLMLYYRALGKRIAFTVHNVNAGWRDSNDTFLNRLTLRIQYRLCDHLFVHTEQMRRELRTHFAVGERKISVIPFGINNSVPNTELTSVDARQRLGLSSSQKVILFFGNIAPYKGLEVLVEALALLIAKDPSYRLVIAGKPKNCQLYWEEIQRRIALLGLSGYVVERIEYVPDADTEIYFKAADVLVLPYKHVFQSGVLFLGYNFGLPTIASDVGSLKEDIIEGKTGFICKPGDSVELSKSIETYFSSQLYQQLAARRREIANFAAAKYSWTEVAKITESVYGNLLS